MSKLNPVLLEVTEEEGMMNYFCPLIYQMTHDIALRRKREGSAILAVELGVLYGTSTIPMAAGINKAGSGFLHSYDLDPCEAAISIIRRAAFDNGVWRFQQMDSVEAASLYPDNYVDLVLLDTFHEFEPTRREIAAWTPKLAPGGRMLFHDTLSFTGVRDALAEFCSINPSWIYYNIDVCAGLGVLTKPK